MLSLNIPVNVALRLQFNDQKIGVTPYMGLNFRVNLFGNQKSGDNKVNLFKEDDMGEDGKKNRRAFYNDEDLDGNKVNISILIN